MKKIAKSDWLKVKALAVKLANASIDNNIDSCDIIRFKILDLLRKLWLKYGYNCNIIATMADYVKDPKERRQLLGIALKLAIINDDNKNILMIRKDIMAEMRRMPAPKPPKMQSKKASQKCQSEGVKLCNLSFNRW